MSESPPRKRLSREESQALTRTRLIDTAQQLFVANGYGGTSIRDIAERAGYSQGAFYSNFASKEEVLLELLRGHMEAEGAQLSSVMDSDGRTPEQIFAELESWAATLNQDASWSMLSIELQLHARRSPAFAASYQTVNAGLRLVAGKAVGDQGTAPKKVIYLEGEKSKKFATAPTQFMSLIPTVYNADTLGIRPDLIKRPINSWAELLNPEFKGKTAILNIPSIGIMDAAMVVEAMGIYKYPDKGNMTKKEIDLTIKTLIEAKKQGQFRALWKDFNESVNLMASGEVVIQSMWSPAVTAVRTKGIACNFQPLKEGYRAWAAGFGLPATLSGRKLDGAYEFINWFLDGWAGAYLNRQGYYSAVLDTAKAKMEAYEWAYWMEGKPAHAQA
eukprot:gene42860-53179_t